MNRPVPRSKQPMRCKSILQPWVDMIYIQTVIQNVETKAIEHRRKESKVKYEVWVEAASEDSKRPSDCERP